MEIKEEDRISGAVLLEAAIGSIFIDNHNGIKIGAPPIPKAAPTTPAKIPQNKYLFI